MRNWRTRSFSIPILVAALLALLLLGALQFAWIGQLSQSARERLEANLNDGAQRISEEFDRELVRAYIDLQMDAETLHDKKWSLYKQRYEHWRASSPYPDIVGAVYLAEIGRNGTINLRQYDQRTGEFMPRTWTSEFAGVLQSLDTTYRTRRNQNELIVGDSPSPINEDLPALMIPVARPWLLGSVRPDESDLVDADVVIGGGVFTRSRRPCVGCDTDGPLFAYTIVQLDRSVIEGRFIPSLARRHLGAGYSDYNMTIVSQRNPNTIIFQSNPEASPYVHPDATADLLTLRLDEFNRLLAASEQTFGDRSVRIGIGTVSLTNQSSLDQADRSGWQLRLTHQSGSLDAAVGSLRNRNLLISGGALLLLALALVMTVVSSRRAQSLARQKVEFVAAISHELRTPLTVICSAGANLADGLIDNPDRTRQYGSLVVREGRRLTEIVEQALAYTGAQTERARPERRLCDPRDIVERALASHRMAIEEQGFTIDYEADTEISPLRADIESLQRAVSNLIGNALKYAGEGHWMRICVRQDQESRRPAVLISVEDRGQGIPAAELPLIFEPFYRGRKAVDAQIHGSGLGLSLVKLAAEAHGGHVVVNSIPGHGCTFTLRLPAEPMVETRSPSHQPSAVSHR